MIANDISSGIWRLDTAPFSYTFPVKIMNLNITKATAGDNILIKDVNGKTIVDFTAVASTTSETDYRIGNLGWTRGVVIATGGLGAGGTAVVTIAVGAGK